MIRPKAEELSTNAIGVQLSANKITLLKKASGKKIDIPIQGPEELDMTLLMWMRLKGLGIASSCDGAGVCRKCVINGEILSCQMKVRQWQGVIEVDYL